MRKNALKKATRLNPFQMTFIFFRVSKFEKLHVNDGYRVLREWLLDSIEVIKLTGQK
jgi:hypothetical protein